LTRSLPKETRPVSLYLRTGALQGGGSSLQLGQLWIAATGPVIRRVVMQGCALLVPRGSLAMTLRVLSLIHAVAVPTA
jgi:hypothetical protein